MESWMVMAPGAKPFTEKELQLDGRKAGLDHAARGRGGDRNDNALICRALGGFKGGCRGNPFGFFRWLGCRTF
jgi:hypothetical protein